MLTQQLRSIKWDTDTGVDGVDPVPDAPPGAADALRDREVGPRVVGGRAAICDDARVDGPARPARRILRGEMRCEAAGERERRTFRAFEGRPIFAARARLVDQRVSAKRTREQCAYYDR